MFFPTLFAVFILTLSLVSSQDSSFNVFLVGSSGELRCSSSFPPPWSKSGAKSGDYRIIGVNGKKHPKWDEPRFEFSKDENDYVIKISDVQLKDAGKYVCEGDSSNSYLVAVVG